MSIFACAAIPVMSFAVYFCVQTMGVHFLLIVLQQYQSVGDVI